MLSLPPNREMSATPSAACWLIHIHRIESIAKQLHCDQIWRYRAPSSITYRDARLLIAPSLERLILDHPSWLVLSVALMRDFSNGLGFLRQKQSSESVYRLLHSDH